jgi:hypothetical protein
MDMQRVFDEFAALLEARYKAGVPTTEDSVRYTFYAAALRHGNLDPAEVVLEYPHPSIPGAEIDTYVLPSGYRAATAIEFKYDRSNPGGGPQNRTQRAGAVFADVFRLARIPDATATKRYFVYLTDREMAGYFRNRANLLDTFFDAAPGSTLTISPSMYAQAAATFRSRVAGVECSCNVGKVLSRDFSSGFFLRAWEVGAA